MVSKIVFSVVLVLAILLFVSSAKASSEMWNQTYGGTKGEYMHSMIQTSDNGYLLVGDTNSFGSTYGTKCWLVKTDNQGNLQWNQTIDATNICSLVESVEGGYALSGNEWLIKVNEQGKTEWMQTFADGISQSLVGTADGGYALAGQTSGFSFDEYVYHDFWLVKTDSQGNKEWSMTYGGELDENGYCLVQTSDKGFAIAGKTQSFDGCWLVKTDGYGKMEWNQTYGDSDSDVAYSLIETSDGGFALAGKKSSLAGGYADFWLIKTDAQGNIKWDKTYGGAEWDVAYALIETSDGGYALTGGTNSFHDGKTAFWTIKTDANGNVQWNQTYKGTKTDTAYAIVQDSNKGYTIAGTTNSFGAGDFDFWLIKTDEQGIIPEFSSWTSLLFVSVTALIAIVGYRKKLQKQGGQKCRPR